MASLIRFVNLPILRDWAVLLLCFGVMATIGTAQGFSGFDSLVLFFVLVLTGMWVMGATALTILRLLYVPGTPEPCELLHLLSMLAGVIMLGVVALYIGAGLAFPLIDTQLIALDGMLGFDWRTYSAWLESIPTLSHRLSVVYYTLGAQLFAVITLLVWRARVQDARLFLGVFSFALVVTVVVATLWPAVGAYVFYDVRIDTLDGLKGRVHEADLLALRAGELRQLVPSMQGLVTFPSFHAACAVLLVWAVRHLRVWRVLFGALNTTMLVATIADGGHYLIDIIGGIVLAWLSVVLVGRARRK
jgi:membrane-associated phospholipid phosphatase